MRRSPNIIYVGDRVSTQSGRTARVRSVAPDHVMLTSGRGGFFELNYGDVARLTPAVDGPQSRSRDGGSGEGEGVNVPDPPPPAPDDLGHRT